MTSPKDEQKHNVDSAPALSGSSPEIAALVERINGLRRAAEVADWQQVVLNGGPPCFHIEEAGDFCLRAKRWDGHGSSHPYTTLAAALSGQALKTASNPQPAALWERFREEAREPTKAMLEAAGTAFIAQGGQSITYGQILRIYRAMIDALPLPSLPAPDVRAGTLDPSAIKEAVRWLYFLSGRESELGHASEVTAEVRAEHVARSKGAQELADYLRALPAAKHSGQEEV